LWHRFATDVSRRDRCHPRYHPSLGAPPSRCVPLVSLLSYSGCHWSACCQCIGRRVHRKFHMPGLAASQLQNRPNWLTESQFRRTDTVGPHRIIESPLCASRHWLQAGQWHPIQANVLRTPPPGLPFPVGARGHHPLWTHTNLITNKRLSSLTVGCVGAPSFAPAKGGESQASNLQTKINETK